MAPKIPPPPLTPPLRDFPFPSPRDPRLVTLHLYLPSGDFVIEVTQRMHDGIEKFAQNCEEGNITPALDLELWNPLSRKEFGYHLLWNGMELMDGRVWQDLVDDHGMSVTEPNDIMVVTYECS